jgi:VWFA-related protein
MPRIGSFCAALSVVATGLWGQVSAPHLVHLYPVVLDSKGRPVTDLTAGDFKIADQGKPQAIFLFRRPAVNGSAALGPNEYTNRPGGVTPHSVAILFDLLNSSDSNRVDTWHNLAKSIPLLESAGQVYFYVLNLEGELLPIHPVGRPGSGGDRAWLSTFAQDLDSVMRNANRDRPAGMDREDRTKRTYRQLEAISNQLATLPGRRDIVWITNTMPTITNSFPCSGDWVECGLYVAHMAVTIGDHGVTVNPYYSSGTPQPAINYALEQMALLTGGHAYYLQDIRQVMKDVARNAANTYELAYAPSPENWDNKFHTIRTVCERKGVKLQVRKRYYALPDSRTAAERQKDSLESCYQKPSDSTGIGLDIRVSPTAKGIHMEIRVDAADLLLREQEGKFSDVLTLVLSDLGEGASAGLLRRPVSDPSVSTFKLDLSKEQYNTTMIEGVRIAFDHALRDEVRQVRVVVMDGSTNEVGSVTFPVGGVL